MPGLLRACDLQQPETKNRPSHIFQQNFQSTFIMRAFGRLVKVFRRRVNFKIEKHAKTLLRTHLEYESLPLSMSVVRNVATAVT